MAGVGFVAGPDVLFALDVPAAIREAISSSDAASILALSAMACLSRSASELCDRSSAGSWAIKPCNEAMRASIAFSISRRADAIAIASALAAPSVEMGCVEGVGEVIAVEAAIPPRETPMHRWSDTIVARRSQSNRVPWIGRWLNRLPFPRASLPHHNRGPPIDLRMRSIATASLPRLAICCWA